MSEREHEREPDADEQVEDLDVPEAEGEEVKGGSLNFSKIKTTSGLKLSSPDLNTSLDTTSLNFSK